jgi:beta-barrel assembly-enhancing protease
MHLRPPLLALLLAGITFAAGAQNRVRLPDLGSSADALISPQEASHYGASMLHQMRAMHLVLDDPQVHQYLNDVGYRLVAASTDPKQKFTFFVVRDQGVNAFAAPGGYIGVNAGLITLTKSESELAAVMAHEIGHIAQHHLERAFEASKKDAPLMALILLGAIAAGSSGHNSGDAGMAVLAGGQGLLAQRQLNFTRADEAEADRVGIQTLASAGYDPEAMANFFQRMEDTLRPGSGGGSVPELLQTHPVTAERISDARARARVLEEQEKKNALPRISNAQLANSTAPVPFVKDPSSLAPPPGNGDVATLRFKLMRERVRVLTGNANKLIDYYAGNFKNKGFDTPSNRYGYALALLRSGQPALAMAQLQSLHKRLPDNLPIHLALAKARLQDGQGKAALASYAAMESNAPKDEAVALAYARALIQAGTRKQARKAEDMLRPLLDDSDDPDLYTNYARASDKAGLPVRAGEAYAYASYLSGRPFDAMQQFRRLLKRPGLNYYQRARINAQIAQLTPLLMELRKRHIDTPDHNDGNALPDRSGDGSASQWCFNLSCS